MIIVLPLLFFLVVSPFTATINGNTSFDVTMPNTVSVIQDPASPFAPNDFYRSFQKGINNIYLLGSNNIVQIYQKIYPNTPVQNFSDYRYSTSPPYNFVDMTINKE